MLPESTDIVQKRTSQTWDLRHTLNSLWHRLSEGLITAPWPFGSSLAKVAILKALSNVSHGRLEVETPSGTYVFGHSDSISSRKVALKVNDEIVWNRIMFFSDLGLAEAFMRGEIECDDVSGLLQIFLANREILTTGGRYSSTSVLSFGRRLTAYRSWGNISTSPSNGCAHFDLGNVLFEAFLSNDLNYSSAIFLDYKEDLVKTPDLCESLEDAQMRKMRNILKKANIRPGDRVLEIGTGWGSLAMLIAKTVDCTVDTITLSKEQRELAVHRIAAEGLFNRVRVHYIDFQQIREKPDWAGAFDRFVSVEMLELVGKERMEEYWSIVNWALKPKSAIGVVQVITLPEARMAEYDKAGADFIQKWVLFPGGYVPSLCFVVNTMNSGSKGHLTIDSVSNIGPHRARTLREWKRRFLAKWECTIAKTLVNLYELDHEALIVFKRKWLYYFDYCEAGFVSRSLGDHIITFTREGNAEFGCDFVAE